MNQVIFPFKGKTNASFLYVMKKTLDICHNDQLKQISECKNQIQNLEAKLLDINSEIEQLEQLKQSGISEDELERQMNLIDQRMAIQDKLREKSSEMDETSYYVSTSDILFKYYDLIEKGNVNQTMDSEAYQKQDSILRFFTCSQKPSTPPTVNMEKSRGSLLDNYMSVINPNYINEKIKDLGECCKSCNSPNITTMLNDGYIFCNVCHTMEHMIVDHDKPSYKDPPKEITYFSYKRINHLNEWLNQIQGKETTDIPEEIYDKILMEIKKQRITNMADLTYNKVKRILKQIKVHKYYEHIPHIINRLNGLPMPNFSQELEEKLRTMFKQIQTPFLKHSPANRKNFLSYSFVLNKFLQLLDKDEYLVFFPLLKSRNKLAEQDKIWKKICEEVNWQFIPSL